MCMGEQFSVPGALDERKGAGTASTRPRTVLQAHGRRLTTCFTTEWAKTANFDRMIAAR